MSPKVEGTGKFETLSTSLVMRSIGYMSVPVPGLPFDEKNGLVPNDLGRVTDEVGI